MSTHTRRNNNIVSIIIPSLNEEKNIARCLDSIAEMETPRSCYEVMLIDNGSTDKTRTIADSYNNKITIKVICVPGVSIATLRNIGAANSQGDILAFVDADCTVSTNWITLAVSYFKDQTIGAVGSSVGIPDETTWVAKAWDLNLSQSRIRGNVECLPTGNLFISRKAYNEIRGFDERLITNEDYDFCYRLRQHGFKIYSDPSIKALHWGVPSNLAEFFKREVWHGTHVFKVFLNNMRELKNWRAVVYALYFTCCLLSCLIGLVYFAVSGHFPLFVLSTMALLVPPILLSLRIIFKQKLSTIHFAQLFIIYFMYGIARAIGTFKIHNWLPGRNA